MASSSHFATAVSFLLFFITLVSAHSNLGSPKPYSKQACKGDTRCKTPCPPVRGNRGSQATWRRGQDVEVVWHKNNHIGGFYRRSLVPVKHMMDHAWHAKTAFDWGCWSQGTFRCGGNEAMCGGDKQQKAYKNRMVVPAVVPDGQYVFAQVWYGGLQWQARAPKYADYYSCAFVTISGGKPMTKSHTGTFQPNPGKKSRFLENIPRSQCGTGSVRVNECDGEACEDKPVKGAVPIEFQGGRRPTVLAATFGMDVAREEPAAVQEASAAVVQDTVEEDLEDKVEDAQVAREQTAEEKQLRDLVTKKSDPTNSNMAINPLDAVQVSVGGRMMTTIKNGQSAEIRYNGGTVKFEAMTQNGQKMERVMIEVAGAGRKFEYVLPYTFEVSRALRMNDYIKIDIKATTNRGRTYEMIAYLKLDSRRGSMSGGRSSNNNSTSFCDRSNMPRKPTGSWGPRRSRKYQRKITQYRAWRAFCKRCRNIC